MCRPRSKSPSPIPAAERSTSPASACARLRIRGFSAALNAGSKPCGAGSSTIAAGDRCTVHVTFQPGSAGSFTSTLQIASNDRTSPIFPVPIAGAGEPVTTLTVRINQLQTVLPVERSHCLRIGDRSGWVPGHGAAGEQFRRDARRHRPRRLVPHVRRSGLPADRRGRRARSQQQPDEPARGLFRHEDRLLQLLQQHAGERRSERSSSSDPRPK